MENDRVFLSYEDAVSMLPNRDDIHTFRSGSLMLVGADWRREDILNALRKYTPELAGESATAMGHGIAIIDENGPLFIETRVE